MALLIYAAVQVSSVHDQNLPRHEGTLFGGEIHSGSGDLVQRTETPHWSSQQLFLSPNG